MSLILSFKVGKCYVGNRTAKDILRCLADYADDNGENCFPGRETIVRESEIHRNSFADALRFLEENSWIKVTRHQKNNSNSYSINVEKIEFGSSNKNVPTVDTNLCRHKNRSTQKCATVDTNLCKSGHKNVSRSSHDPVNIQSYIHMSSEQNSDDLQSGSKIESSEEFTLTPPEENESPEQEEKELTPKQRSIQIGKRCPQEKLVELYHECLPSLKQVRTWTTASRRQNLAARWREMSERQEFQSEQDGLDFFKGFFEFVGRSPFLLGQIKTRDGSRSWRADLPWLIKAENFANVCDGKYHD